MGVDIFLNSLWQPFEAKYKEPKLDERDPEASMNRIYDEMRASDGYFRNGYNSGDVMWAMGLSWANVRLMLDSDFFLPVASARELIDTIEAHPLTRERVAAHISEHMAGGVDQPGNIQQMLEDMIGRPRSLEVPDTDRLFAFLNARRDQLLTILRKSVDLNEPLHCSA